MTPSPASRCRKVPRTVVALGLVALCMDISSEASNSLLPLYLIGTLGASAVTVGVIEGIAAATAAIAKVFSGLLSDRIRKRKLLTVVGYGLSALSKPMFPLATSAAMVLGARFLDRIGKGVRDAPRDALVADVTPPDVRGVAYGLRQALDTAGAFAGPLMAMGLMAIYSDDFRTVFWWAVLPALAAVLLVVFAVQEPATATSAEVVPIRRADVRRLGRRCWTVMVIGVVFTMARFSEAFLILKGQQAGLPLAVVPIVWVVMNLVYSLLATPAGAWSDRFGRRIVLIVGLGLLVAADMVLAFTQGLSGLFIGVALWGGFMGLSQSLLSALVADTAPDDLRGTAFGVFSLITGGTLLVASTLAGVLWRWHGSTATFAVGAIFAAAAAAALIMTWKRAPNLP